MLRVFTDNCDKNTHTHTCKHTKNVKISPNITEIWDISKSMAQKKRRKKVGFFGFFGHDSWFTKTCIAFPTKAPG